MGQIEWNLYFQIIQAFKEKELNMPVKGLSRQKSLSGIVSPIFLIPTTLIRA